MSTQDTLDFNSNDALELGAYAQQAYLEYALSVVKGRALPQVSDGQKPVQRRILYSMFRMGLAWSGANGAKPVKSARVVGDVLGRFHPHGDQAAYDALVRMAQDFAQRYPLVDGQGNFGSRDGDGAAAMRYTEARLTPLARVLMEEIDEGTVAFTPNYDGSTEEPRELPARLPFVLLNGASGIAVGMATEVPSHNLGEVAAAAVALLKQPQLPDDELYGFIPGPDFPGGAQIISTPEEIRAAYASGRGSLKLRARWKIEDLARGQWQLVITELPHGVSSQKVLEEIEEISNPKVKTGKKAVTPEQLQLKNTLLAVLDGVRDESSKDAAVRLVFEPKSRTVSVDELTQVLLAHTSLETSSSLNLTMVGLDGKPVQKNLRQILVEWLAFRQVTIEKRSSFRLQKAEDRIHILEGRQQVLLNIDEVIRIIRNSDEPKPALIESFRLSDRQAEDILEIRLRQLARLEAIKIEQELKSLREEADKLRDILANPSSLKRLMVKEIEADAKAFGDARRTLIQAEKRASAELKIVDEAVTVVVSQKGWARALKGHEVDVLSLGFKAGDTLYAAFPCRSVDTLIAIGSSGRSYSVAVSQLPGGRGDGVPMTSLIELEPGTQLLHYIAGPAGQSLVLANSGGFGLVATIGDLTASKRAGKTFLALEAGELPLPPCKVDPAQPNLAVLTAEGKLLTYAVTELKLQPKGGRGLTLIDLEAGDKLLAACCYATQLHLSGLARGNKPKEDLLRYSGLAFHAGKRAKKGKPVEGFKQVLAIKGPEPASLAGLAFGAVLLLHGALLMLLALPALQHSPQPQRLLLHLPRPLAPAPAGQKPNGTTRAKVAAITMAVPAVLRPVLEAPALPAASAPPAAALDLRLPAAGPQARQAARASSPAGLANLMRSDPRANSPRLSLEERFAVALGTPCFVDELNADGQVQRYPGRWVALPSQSDSIWQGVTGNTGVGGKAPPIAAPTCQRQ